MSSKPSIGQCTICECQSTAIEWHHTVPQAYGGHNSLQIPVCSDCHGLVHKKADALFAFLKNGTAMKKQNFWRSLRAEKNAQPFVEIIVRAMLDNLNANSTSTETKQIKIRSTLDAETHKDLIKLKTDLNFNNLEQTIRYCIQFTLNNKGFGNERQSAYTMSNTRSSQTDVSLWAMRRSGKRTSRE